MAASRRESSDPRLRAANVARRHDDAFFQALADLAAASEKAPARRRPTAARVASVALGTGLLLSGGAVASALILIKSDAHHQLEPRPATTVHLYQSASPAGADATGASTADDNGPGGQQEATVGPGRAHQGGDTSDHALQPPGNAYGLHGQTPQGNANGQRPHQPQRHAHSHSGQAPDNPQDNAPGQAGPRPPGPTAGPLGHGDDDAHRPASHPGPPKR